MALLVNWAGSGFFGVSIKICWSGREGAEGNSRFDDVSSNRLKFSLVPLSFFFFLLLAALLLGVQKPFSLVKAYLFSFFPEFPINVLQTSRTGLL